MVVVVVVWAPHRRWLMVVVPFMGGCSWPFVVGVGGWWWCSCRHVGGAVGRSMLVVCVVIGRRSPLVFSCHCLLFVVVCHCASFIGVVIVQCHFVSHGDVAADMLGGLPIGEG